MRRIGLITLQCNLLVFCLMLSWFTQAQTSVNLGPNAGNLGSGNVSIGYGAGDIVTNNDNVFVGYVSGGVTTTGTVNTFVGAYSGRYNTTGHRNCFYGYFSGQSNTTGTYNTFVGTYSGHTLTSGSSNTFLGTYSGYTNSNGSGNVFLGFNAGYNETGSDKLYIDNSNTTTPLIYGDFSTNKVGINALPGSYTLNVGGTINAASIHINGVPFAGGGSQWATSGSNINYDAGIVSIGTTATPAGYKLAIGGKVVAEEVVVKLQANWPDYVFEPGYKLPSLSDLEKFILTHKHLPGVPTASDITQDGVSLGEMNAVLLKKIEELTLLLIDQQKQIDVLRASRN